VLRSAGGGCSRLSRRPWQSAQINGRQPLPTRAFTRAASPAGGGPHPWGGLFRFDGQNQSSRSIDAQLNVQTRYRRRAIMGHPIPGITSPYCGPRVFADQELIIFVAFYLVNSRRQLHCGVRSMDRSATVLLHPDDRAVTLRPSRPAEDAGTSAGHRPAEPSPTCDCGATGRRTSPRRPPGATQMGNRLMTLLLRPANWGQGIGRARRPGARGDVGPAGASRGGKNPPAASSQFLFLPHP
jgi:hypothetical protein